MLRHLAEKHRLGRPRKRLLLKCAWCRTFQQHLSDPLYQQALDLMERYADNRAPRAEVQEMFDRLNNKLNDRWAEVHAANGYEKGGWPMDCRVAYAVYALYRPLAAINESLHGCEGVEADHHSASIEHASQYADLIREIFGNPFTAARFNRALRTWKDATIVRIAKSIYDQRDFTALPVLGDALEEAGCADADILGHLRGTRPHVLGCWVLDLVLNNR
jgi:hypothetical protein